MDRINSVGKDFKRKIIFLDIDGVLASMQYLISGKGYIDKEKVSLINQLKGAEIVISSSWGYDGGRTEKSLRDCGLILPIVGYTQHFHVDYLCRGNEIEKWINENIKNAYTKYGKKYSDERFKYVIFDDDEDMLYGQKDNFIKIDRETAITQEDIDKAKKILFEE